MVGRAFWIGGLLAVTVAGVAWGGVVKEIIRISPGGKNLLRPDGWGPYKQGFTRDGNDFVCDNGTDGKAQRGVSQTVMLNQTEPLPIVASAFSKAENVGGSRDSDYSLYLDILYADGEPLWGQTANFSIASHDWERREVKVIPVKPIKQVSVHLLLRGHSGKAFFRDARLAQIEAPKGAAMFDGVPVVAKAESAEGFAVRDAAAGSDFVSFENGKALGLTLQVEKTEQGGVTFHKGTLADTTGKDRAVTLVFTVPVAGDGWRWLADPRTETPIQPGREYLSESRFPQVGGGRCSRYPLAAVARETDGRAIAIDMGYPAFFRAGFSAGSRELYLAYDFGLTGEKPSAEFRFCTWRFDASWGVRSAVARLYEVFADHFRCRTPQQGVWMPFHKISAVQGWEDFGFAFKEGNDETAWDDQHGIITFRYTEPMTWWMRMPKDMPRTLDAAVAEAKRLAEKGDKTAGAFLASAFHDESGRCAARFLDTPWCNGAVWSVNSSPTVKGDLTDFKVKWNPDQREKLYGKNRKGDLDGEYVDSAECYVTDMLDFRRDHFAGARAPLAFSSETHRPGLFKLLSVQEYVRGLSEDVHGMGKLMMANSTPSSVCWLTPWLDVMGTETDWNPGNRWRPMSDAELLYRRVLCGPKPYCFLMNTNFDEFPKELSEKFMKRCLAYGMFPGYFSANASQGHYFSRPELYNRDRPLFKKYLPLCKLVAQAGWRPVTGARGNQASVYLERFGQKYLTVFNDGKDAKTVTITFEGAPPSQARELLGNTLLALKDAGLSLTLEPEDVAVIELK